MKKIKCSLIKIGLSLLLSMIFFVGCGGSKEGDKKENQGQIEKTQEETTGIPKKEYLKVLNVTTNSGEKSYIEISLSDELEFNKDLEGYVFFSRENEAEENIDYTVSSLKNKIIISGYFPLDNTYTLKIMKGLKSKNSLILNEEFETGINFRELEAKLVFSNDGIVLPNINDKKIAFRSVNVKKVNIEVAKIFENNTTQFLQNYILKGNGNNEYGYDLQSVGENILKKEYELDYVKNKWMQTEIDLGSVVDSEGIYLVNIYFDKEGIDYEFPKGTDYWQEYNFFQRNSKINKAIIISDMGVIGQKTKDNFIITVRDLSENTLVEGVNVKGVSYNNQVIEEVKTDKNGDAYFSSKNDIFYFLAEKDGERSILKLKDTSLNYDGFAVGGVYTAEGIEAFIYTDRGVYRPGDKVNLSVIARNDDGSFPANHPIKLNVYTPTGKKYIEDKVINSDKEGYYTYEFQTSMSDETGIWKADFNVGNKIVRGEIAIETVVPYKIKVEIDAPKEVEINNITELEVGVFSEYLFGGKGSDLKYNAELSVSEENPRFEKYLNYTFKNPTNYDFYQRQYKDGKLDEEGRGKIKFETSKLTSKNVNTIGKLTVNVLETNGRPVKKQSIVKFKKFDSFVGIENLEERYIKVGDKINLQTIVVSSDGEKLVSGKKMKYKIYKNEYSWWWDYGSYTSFLRSIKTDVNTKLIYEGSFISGEKPYLIDYAVQGEGEIYVEVEDILTKQSTGTTVYASTWIDSSNNKKIDKLKMEMDKKSYAIGEKAKITYEGTKGAKGLFTIEQSGKIIKRYWKDIEDIKNVEEVQITKEMFPNAYMTIAVYQDYNEITNNRPLRLYGAVPLIVEDESTKLNIKLDVPKEIRPNEEFVVNIQGSEKMDYTIAVVDEGLLDITNFATPSPWNYFYQKRALETKFYDNYNEIMGKIFGEVNQVLETGGDDFIEESLMMSKNADYREKELGGEEAKRFKPVALFEGVLTTDENGRGQVKFIMPNYMGSVRVMVVGASKEKYGSTEERIIVKAPIVPNISLPRTLKIGDKFQIPIEVFILEDGLETITVKLTVNDKTFQEKIKGNKGDKEKVNFEINAPHKIGKTEVKLEIESSKYNYTETIEIDVNSTNSYTYLNELKALNKDENGIYLTPKDVVEGSAKGYVQISTSPILALDERLEWLIRYPYGCGEQTVSSIFPQLYIKELANEEVFNEEKIIGNINAGIGKLANFQLYNGGFSYWQGQDKVNPWVTNYVGHFLIKAKEEGYYVPEEMYSKWKKYTIEQIKNSSVNPNFKAYGLYLLALAGEPQISETNLIYENYMDSLIVENKWYIGATYKLMGKNELAKEIGDSLELKPAEVLTREELAYEQMTFGSSLKTKAIILGSYYEIYEKLPKELYEEVLKELQGQGWLSTQSIGYSLITLANIKEENSKEEVSDILLVDGKEIEYKTTAGKYIYKLKNEDKEIEITNKNEKPLFSNFYWEGLPVNYQRENEAENISVKRKFYDIHGKELDPKKLESGTSFWMELEVLPSEDAKEYFYVENVALTQILPSGWEIENLRVLNEDYPSWIKSKQGNSYFDYEDIRDDRVMWFFNFDNYRNTSKKFFVKLNTVTKGEFQLPGTKVEAMYNPNYKAYLKGNKVWVD